MTTPSDYPSVADQLVKLAALHASGALSDDEFQKIKSELIAKELGEPRSIDAAKDIEQQEESGDLVKREQEKTQKQYLILGLIVIALIGLAVFVITQLKNNNPLAISSNEHVADTNPNDCVTLDCLLVAAVENRMTGERCVALAHVGIIAETEEQVCHISGPLHANIKTLYDVAGCAKLASKEALEASSSQLLRAMANEINQETNAEWCKEIRDDYRQTIRIYNKRFPAAR